MAVYYRKLVGNINDVATIRQLIDDFSFLGIDKVKLVMDRGFYIEGNINDLFEKHYKFLIGTKKSLQFVKGLLDDVRDSMKTLASYSSEYKINAYSRTIEWAYKAKRPRSEAIETGTRRAYLHLYFDDQKAVDDKAVLNALLDTLEEEIRTNRRTEEHKNLYTMYYDISTTPIRGTVLIPKQEAISAVEKKLWILCAYVE